VAPSGKRKAIKRLSKKSLKLILNKTTNNRHIIGINNIFNYAKTKDARKKRLAFSEKFFLKKEKSLKDLLNQIINGNSPEDIFRKFEDFDIACFKRIGARAYSNRLTKDIKSIIEARKYTCSVLKKL